ncbi:MAG: isopentenyl phosphate kinase family protein [Methanomassiliicoccaceae archaeon]|jgi:isopentenyl phosphate kinase|nr:isopentenyl phosphate kinase family protein [Methanomassiliicoccaceae archaeon]
MILIKLGGSVITDKKEYKRFNKEVVSRLCREIKDSEKDVMIVHGAGSFGHVLAKEFELQKGRIRDDQTDAVARVSRDVRELNNLIIKELIDAGIPAVSIPTGACFIMNDNELHIDPKVMQMYISIGIVPVMFGDVVTDTKKGFGICSGDRIIKCLADIFSPDKIIFVSDIDGIYDRDPKISRDAKLIAEVNEEILEQIPSEMTVDDVTGGVHAKMRTMLDMCSDSRDCILVNGTVDGRLNSLLKGMDVVCTRARK